MLSISVVIVNESTGTSGIVSIVPFLTNVQTSL